MKNYKPLIIGIPGIIILPFIIWAGWIAHSVDSPVPARGIVESHTPDYMSAFFDASRVYGKVGCGDIILAEKTAQASIKSGVPANLIAGLIATESTCNPLAVSNKGAIGLMQVVPKTWAKSYDFTKINLFNPDDNMEVGTKILADLIKKFGLKNALAHYYGTGNDGIGGSGDKYSNKVQLMGAL